jgi:hypothetical protein
VVLLSQVMEHYLQITQTFHDVYWAKHKVQRRHIRTVRGLGYRSVVAFPSLASIIRLYENYESPCSVTAGKFHKFFHLCQSLWLETVSFDTETLIVSEIIFTRNPIQDSFWVCDLHSRNLRAETQFLPGAILLSFSVSELRKLSSV